MGASELNKSQPVFRLFAPAGTQAAAFGKSAECALDDPTARWKLSFTGHRTFLNFGFAATPTVFDVGNIALELDKLMNIRVIVAFIQSGAGLHLQ